ncbi:MAG TPA: hypothetical protein VFA21_10730 [Pyrinomonadaceae bacterium]|nr:hypothetical protein [Pyrinomonadaceae bacterium]
MKQTTLDASVSEAQMKCSTRSNQAAVKLSNNDAPETPMAKVSNAAMM